MCAHCGSGLHEEFPRDAEMLHRLSLANAHFCNLAGRYHAVSRALRRIEAELEPAGDHFAETLRRQRLSLLDEITAILERAEARYAAA